MFYGRNYPVLFLSQEQAFSLYIRSADVIRKDGRSFDFALGTVGPAFEVV